MSDTTAAPETNKTRPSKPETERQGFVHLYTGNGKGKTTAALGLALRAAGHRHRVYIGQFLKGMPYGENLILAGHDLITVEQYGTEECVAFGTLREEHRVAAREGLERSRVALESGEYELVVLDEVDVAIWFGALEVEEVLEVVDARPDHVELVLTGRRAPRALKDRAHLITEMREVRHYYADKGVTSREGVEY